MDESVDVAIVGAGAAGLMAAIWAARSARAAGRALRVVALDGAARPGAKILVAGGGRCNVTHDAVDESAFCGSSRHAVRKVLLRFDVARTVAFFRELGVELKREETGKLFPVTDDARTVLDALLRAVREAGAELRHPARVRAVRRRGETFHVEHDAGALCARRVVLATGGMSLPKTGSDGAGYGMARALGHTITPHVFPALVPLKLAAGHFLTGLSGVSAPARVEVRTASGRRLASFTGPVLCSHFGVSGPAILDISRHYTSAALGESGACADAPGTATSPRLVLNWLPGETPETLDAALRDAGARSAARALGERLPERLARALCAHAGVEGSAPAARLPRAQRRALACAVTELEVPVVGDRGFAHAEVTAGGVPLREIRLDTMESRVCPGLHLCGEVCDVDGRIGGYNFQWAWASGHVAGTGCAAGLEE